MHGTLGKYALDEVDLRVHLVREGFGLDWAECLVQEVEGG